MKKPLELTVYPKVDRWVPWSIENYKGETVTGSRREYGYETPQGVFQGDEFQEKRLTDAELAAEFHLAVSDFQATTSLYLLFEDVESEQKVNGARDWMFCMEHFATLPHYDEQS